MFNKVLVATGAIIVLSAATASAATTIIGGVTQSNSQGVNSSQVGSNGAGGGNVFILGDSQPTLTQTSVNILSNHQQIGGAAAPCTPPYCPAPTANFTLIGNASQVNNQAVNSQQVGVNGAGGGPGSTFFVGGNSLPLLFQSSTNLLFSEIILG